MALIPNISPKLYDELREHTLIPGTTVDKLRDVVHYGSGDPARWKSGYKKDYPYHQPSDLIVPDSFGLRQTGEIILPYENQPFAVSETRTSHKKIPCEQPQRDFRWTKGHTFNRDFLGGDPRLTSFENTTSKNEHCAMTVTARQPVDKIMKIGQSYSVPVGDPKMKNQHIRPKNMEEYPDHGAVDRRAPAPAVPSQIGQVMMDPSHEFVEQSIANTTYRAYNPEDFAKKRLFKEELTPKSSLFTLTNLDTPTSEQRHGYRRFTPQETQSVKPENHKSTEDCKNLFYKDPRIVTPLSTTQDIYVALDSAGIKVGKRQAEFTYGGVVGNDMEIEEKFLPKYIYQQSLTRGDYPHWGNDVYRPPGESNLSYPCHIPLCMEDGPINKMITSHQDEFPAHPLNRVKPVLPSAGGILTALPMGVPLKVWTSETMDRFKTWSMTGNCVLLNPKDQHAQTMVEAKDVVDFRTTNVMAYPAHPRVITTPVDPIKSRNPVLNDGNGVATSSPFEWIDKPKPYVSPSQLPQP
ncbi:hypothetical protein BV898_08881 [Hypsibius exemplaris]|uniref:Uncharacterized protein n=1 Tax=Hypsibius exemplaris TaxID=2072580 RepID=A0A1W0WP87_HYPEX|nr:hypothetical protein BV898_08881 [Hypsibius exemplaris]